MVLAAAGAFFANFDLAFGRVVGVLVDIVQTF